MCPAAQWCIGPLSCHSEPVTDVTGVGIRNPLTVGGGVPVRPSPPSDEGGVMTKGHDGGRDDNRIGFLSPSVGAGVLDAPFGKFRPPGRGRPPAGYFSQQLEK